MHKILQTLVMLQDLDCMIAEVSSKDMKNIEKKMGLKIKGEDQLQEARERLEQSLPPAVLSKYHKLMKRFGRAVVPVVGVPQVHMRVAAAAAVAIVLPLLQ